MGPFGKVVAQIKMMEEHVWTRKINASYDAPKKELKLKEGTDYDIKSTGHRIKIIFIVRTSVFFVCDSSISCCFYLY